MSEFFYLIPLSLALGLVGLVVFLWSLRAGQYEDLDGAAERILLEDTEAPRAGATAPDDAPPQRT